MDTFAAGKLSERQRRVLDTAIAEAARCALRWRVFAFDDALTLDVTDGRLTLGGAVAAEHERAAALEAVRSVAGVRGVEDRLVVEPGRPAAHAAAGD